MSKDIMTERINYIIADGKYIGKMVNFPCIVQADSLEELKSKSICCLKSWHKLTAFIFKAKEPFELIEVNEFPD